MSAVVSKEKRAELFAEFDSIGESAVRIAIDASEYKDSTSYSSCSKEWLRLLEEGRNDFRHSRTLRFARHAAYAAYAAAAIAAIGAYDEIGSHITNLRLLIGL